MNKPVKTMSAVFKIFYEEKARNIQAQYEKGTITEEQMVQQLDDLATSILETYGM